MSLLRPTCDVNLKRRPNGTGISIHALDEVTLSNSESRKLLLEAVDEGLSLLGESTKQVTYSCLEKSFNIKKQEIPNKIKDFSHAIKEIFGSVNFVEPLILKRFNEKVGAKREF